MQGGAVMVTADTITDEQIRELLESARGVDYDTYRVAQQALDAVEHARGVADRALRNPAMVDIAQIKILAHRVLRNEWERARCAEILNTRGPCQHSRIAVSGETRRCVECGEGEK